MFDFSKNYFDLFGMPVGFVLDAAELSVRYRELQKVVHPDRYAASDGQSQRLSLQRATTAAVMELTMVIYMSIILPAHHLASPVAEQN